VLALIKTATTQKVLCYVSEYLVAYRGYVLVRQAVWTGAHGLAGRNRKQNWQLKAMEASVYHAEGTILFLPFPTLTPHLFSVIGGCWFKPSVS